jgi:iron-sulfur cluster insertion protein
MPDTTTEDERFLLITDRAAKRVAELIAAEESDGTMLRVTISGGGCSGFQYGFKLDGQQNDDDLVFEHNGVKVLVDETSMDLVKGAELDYVEELIGSYFALRNPNASSTCGCGTSFSI